MKSLIGVAFAFLVLNSVVSCGAKEEEKVQVDVDKQTPEYKAYELVQNLQTFQEFKEKAESKKQTVSLRLSKERLNGKNGFYWFQVILHIGSSNIVKMNIKVREDSFKVAFMDEDTGFDLSEAEYRKKFPIK